jgi:hypothetical protein
MIANSLSAQVTVRYEREVGNILTIGFEDLPGGCESEEEYIFQSVATDTFCYHDFISSNELSQQLKISSNDTYDSINVFDRYASCIGWEVSETEGVIFLDTNWSDFEASKLFILSEWNSVKQKDGFFDFTHYKYNSHYLQPIAPKLSANELAQVYDHTELTSIIDPAINYKPYIYMTELKVLIYKNETVKEVHLHFFYRHGEC